MAKARWRIRICLLVVVAIAVGVGAVYYWQDRKIPETSEGVLITVVNEGWRIYGSEGENSLY